MVKNLIKNLLVDFAKSYKIINEENELPTLLKENIKSFFDYKYEGKSYDLSAKVVFSDIEFFDETKIIIICDNPKYVMYDFIFNVVAVKVFSIEETVFENQNSNIISGISRVESTSQIGFNNTIGAKPFSFYKVNARIIRVKPMYSVNIQADVVIGNNNVIDAGIFSDTFIGKGTRIDSNTYIAHDVTISEDCIITSGVSIGGFTKINSNVYIGLNATVKNNTIIGENVTIGMGSVVTKSFGDNVIIYGNPATIRGYKCSCGNKLNVSAFSVNCSCGNEYKVLGNKVVKI